MRTFEDEIRNLIAVDMAVLAPHRRRGIAGLDQYRRTVEVHGVQDVAVKIAESFCSFAIFDGEQVLRYPAITPFITETLYALPIELRREACDRDRLKADRARGHMAQMISSALLKRYRFEQLKCGVAPSSTDWDGAFERQFGNGQKAAEG
ncbi:MULTISPECIES: hypothetical protein [unclassified Sinorhizobium]|uniref:hypothetical protein n=1 Tax=unclassified Sinorhizobium TaxID=2613772 RepID=UPI0024C21B98|nr:MULTISPECIES: hypothetical protein [unclassified Sinorhizobium]MDK1376825.1 hypothetical protein [Sinorhizobium sp. 6-70]MDK1481074.1 hypothetical protein [Sinorhizobium sp. 6-117]